MTKLSVEYEQAVYGSFPFWDRGYAILASSPGCRPEWLSDLRAVCQRYGERPSGEREAHALFALRLVSGPWVIVGVGPQGVDDQGRPGALAFHAIFLKPSDYRRAGGNPFSFVPLLRNDWTAETATLPTGTWEEPSATSLYTLETSERASRIALALARGRRVALQESEPIDDLAQDVWRAMPPQVRGRLSLATWAFGNGNRFDLVALPRLAGVSLDSSYLDPVSLNNELWVEASFSARALRTFQRLPQSWPWFAAAVLLLGIGLLFFFTRYTGEASLPDVSHGTSELLPPPPDREDYPATPLAPEERSRVVEGLVDMAERFGVLDPAVPGNGDPATLMSLIAARLRYVGPLLTTAEQGRLQTKEPSESARDRDLARQWDSRIRRFIPDRVLPSDFATGPFRWQLDTLAWSFHLDDFSLSHRRSPLEATHALADALALDVPVRPLSLGKQEYPALQHYFTFLDRLPRR